MDLSISLPYLQIEWLSDRVTHVVQGIDALRLRLIHPTFKPSPARELEFSDQRNSGSGLGQGLILVRYLLIGFLQ